MGKLGSFCVTIEVNYSNFPGVSEENYENPSVKIAGFPTDIRT
jgi:hypothetical protein